MEITGVIIEYIPSQCDGIIRAVDAYHCETGTSIFIYRDNANKKDLTDMVYKRLDDLLHRK